MRAEATDRSGAVRKEAERVVSDAGVAIRGLAESSYSNGHSDGWWAACQAERRNFREALEPVLAEMRDLGAPDAEGAVPETVNRWWGQIEEVLGDAERDIASEMRAAAKQPPAEGRTLACELLDWADCVEALRDRTDEHPSLAYKLGQVNERARIGRDLEGVLADLRHHLHHLPIEVASCHDRIEEVLRDE